MDSLDWIIFAAAVGFGSYVQAVAGFGMGMIMMAGIGASGAITLPVLTAVVTLVTLLNIVTSLRGHLVSVDRKMFLWLAIGQIPAVVIGVFVNVALDRDARWVLELLLGLFITAGSLLMMIRPKPIAQVSPPWACFTAGIGGGIISGLFAASGPILGLFGYRQPLPLAVIRATLLASFALSSLTRVGAVAYEGGITSEVVKLSALAAPPVLAGVWLGRNRAPPVSEATLKRFVFGLLVVLGVYIIVRAI